MLGQELTGRRMEKAPGPWVFSWPQQGASSPGLKTVLQVSAQTHLALTGPSKLVLMKWEGLKRRLGHLVVCSPPGMERRAGIVFIHNFQRCYQF